MLAIWKWFNLMALFVLELIAFVAPGIWAWQLDAGLAVRIPLTIGLPLLAVVLWGLFAAPRAKYDVRPAALAVKVLVLVGCPIALWASGRHAEAIAYAAVLVANQTAIRLGKLDAEISPPPSRLPVSGPPQ